MTNRTLAEQMRAMTASEVLEKLPALSRQRRIASGLSYGRAAEAIGVSKSTLHRLEGGGEAQLSIVTAVVCWLESYV